MPHDRNGTPLAEGDLVNIPCVLKSVTVGDYCTAQVETVEVMPGNGDKNTYSLNAKQLEKVGSGKPSYGDQDTDTAKAATEGFEKAINSGR